MDIHEATIGDLLNYLEEMEGGELRYTGEDEDTGEVQAVVIVATRGNAQDILDALSDWEVSQVAPLKS